MTPEQIVDTIVAQLEGVVPKASWGETALFYNPGRVLPNGVYFCTLKEHDGTNDQASRLNREGVFRLSLGLPPAVYAKLFGPKPSRPSRGGVVATGHAFDALDTLMPHPIYAWMSWVQILTPSSESFSRLWPLVEEAHRAAVLKFQKSRSRCKHDPKGGVSQP